MGRLGILKAHAPLVDGLETAAPPPPAHSSWRMLSRFCRRSASPSSSFSPDLGPAGYHVRNLIFLYHRAFWLPLGLPLVLDLG